MTKSTAGYMLMSTLPDLMDADNARHFLAVEKIIYDMGFEVRWDGQGVYLLI